MGAPFNLLGKFFRRDAAPIQTRQLEAAAGGRRWEGRPAGGDANSWMRAGAPLISVRAQHYALNNPHGARMVQALADNGVGTGIKPKCRAESPILRAELHRGWEAWTDVADWTGALDFYGMQRSAMVDLVTFGEALFIWRESLTGIPQLQRLHPDQLDRSNTRVIDGQARIVQGVEFAATGGKPVAYWIRPSAPGESLAGSPLAVTRVPASDIIHVFRPLVPGQVRGLSWLAPVLLPGHELDQLIDALIVRAKVSAMHTGFIYNSDGSGAPYSGAGDGAGGLDASLEPGAMFVLPSNKRVEFSEPPDSGNAPELCVSVLRMMAVGVGLTYEQLTGDYSRSTYSSARAASLEFRRFCESIQHHVLVYQLCRPVWQQFMRWQILSGRVSATEFSDPTKGLQTAKWLPPSWPWIDPLKDANAAIREIEANLRSRSEVIAERGYDAEEIDAEIAADKARATRLKIVESSNAP